MTPPFGLAKRALTPDEEEAARRLEEAWNVLHAAWSAWRQAPESEALRLEGALDAAAHRIEDASVALERAARLRIGSR